MAAIGQERIEIGTNIRLRLAPSSPDGTTKKLPDTSTAEARKTLATTGRLVAFAQECNVNFESTLTDTNNKDSGIFQSSVPTLLGANVDATFLQPQWEVEASADITRLTIKEWFDVFLKRQYLWVTFGTATFTDTATDPVHTGNVIRFWALLSSIPLSQTTHEIATVSVSLQSTGEIYNETA